MKRLLSLCLCCCLALSLLPGCAPASAARELSAQPITISQEQLMAYDPSGPGVYAALSSFGLDLLKASRQEGESVLVSPLSVALALSMAANGAQGDTLTQFEQVLGGGAHLEAVNVACHALTSIYQNLQKGSTQCSIANSLWIDPEGQIREDFIGKCSGIFDAQVFQGDLSAPGIVGDLNGWVSQHTNKMIPQIVTKPFPENTAALLVNALYLDNTWETEFDPNSTHTRTFTHADGTRETMDFLGRGSSTLPYLRGDGAQGVVLPYDDGRLGFVALMPDLYPDAPDLDRWLDTLEGEVLSLLVKEGEEAQFLFLALPKFEAEWSGQLQDVLVSLGLEDAFTPGQADFSLLGDRPEGYFLSRVIHAAKIQVNEKGTRAAAATVVETNAGSAPPEEGITLVFDRPFLYGIFDLQNSVPLFLGIFA